MKHKYNIPGKINVGFQKRGGTYTGKLAYVVYTDDKGVLRKETSWNGWRDQKIAPEEFENVPTEGFVLNKKVGETRWSHDPRKAWVRVYDPRDFEFEIDVSNLLLILQECTSVKGKGLEGEFVYAWSGAKLLLLPVDSQEYKESVAYKQACKQKITKKDIKEGFSYLNKDGDEVMYLGRLPHWRFHWGDDGKIEFKCQKKHIFAYLQKDSSPYSNRGDYFVQSGFTKIISKLSDDPCPSFADKFDEYHKSKYGSGPQKLVTTKTKRSKEYYDDKDFIEKGGKIYFVSDYYEYRYGGGHKKKLKRSGKPVEIKPDKSVTIYRRSEVEDNSLLEDPRVHLYVVNESGNKIGIGDYYR